MQKNIPEKFLFGRCTGLVLCLPIVIIFACSAFGGTVSDGTKEWDDSSFIGFFDPPYNQASVDSISAYYGCSSTFTVGSSLVEFRLPFSQDIESIVTECSTWYLPSFRSAGLNYVLTMQAEVEGSSVPGLTNIVPEDLKFNCGVVSDSLSQDQWYLGKDCLNVCEAWGVTSGEDTNVVVIILDSGIDFEHREFVEGVNSGRIEVEHIAPIDDGLIWQVPGMDYAGHGTQMAGIIGAPHSSTGISGIAPDVRLKILNISYCPENASIPSDCLDPGRTGMFHTNFIFASAGLERVAQIAESNPEKRFILNCSWGFNLRASSDYVRDLSGIFQRFVDAGNVVVIASVGNITPGLKDGGGPIDYSYYPGLFSGERGPYYSEYIDNIVVTVGAVTYYDNSTGSDSNLFPYGIKARDDVSWAAEDTCQMIADVSAPGGGQLTFVVSPPRLSILTTTCSNMSQFGFYDYFEGYGTSLATAMISGISALAWSAHPEYTPEELKSNLRMFSKTHMSLKISESNPDPGEPNITRTFYKRYGASWGYHSYRGLRTDSCPIPTPADGVFEPPPIFPLNSDKAAGGQSHFDKYCSVVFGSGMVDASDMVASPSPQNIYKVYGGILEENLILEEGDVVRVYGDLVVPANMAISITPGDGSGYTKFTMFGGDLARAGQDTNLAEIIIEDGGRFETGAGDLLFVPYQDDIALPNSWFGLKIEAGGVFGDLANPVNLDIRNSMYGLEILSEDFFINDLILATEGIGLSLNADITLNTINITGAPFLGVHFSSPSALVLESGGSISGSVLNHGNVGLTISPGSRLEINAGELAIDNCYFGVFALAGDSVTVAGDMVVTNCGTGFSCYGGGINFDGGNVSVEGPGNGVGFVLENAQLGCKNGGSIDIADYDLGISGLGDINIYGDIQVYGALIHGLLIENSNYASIDGLSFENCNQDGVRIESASGVILKNLLLRNNQGSGLGVHLSSNCNVRNSVFEGNSSGIFCDGNSMVDGGHFYPASQRGGNSFSIAKMFGVVSLNNNETLFAEGNSWYYKGVWVCPPDPGKIIGNISTVCQ